MTHLAITLLGAPLIERDGILLDLTIRKAMALLAYLAVTDLPHTRDTLAALFWPETDQERARGALRYTLSQLKAAIGEGWLLVTREQIGLRTETNLTVDVRQVDQLLTQIARHGHPPQQPCATCLPLLQAILTYQQGAFLSGFSLPDSPAFDDWQFFEGERLQRIQTEALRTLITFYQDASEPASALPYAQRLAALDPLQEQVNELLIHLYLESGQAAAALRHYQVFAKLLRAEFDALPDPALTARIEHLAGYKTVGTAPPPLPRERVLPQPMTPLLGRNHELVAISTLFDDPACRLLTLVGPGGSGKTRLALAYAHQRQRTQEVVFIPLAGLTTPNALLPTLLAAVGCPSTADRDLLETLLTYLGTYPYLLILDNLEHLLEEADAPANPVVDLLDKIITIAPATQLLVTSRVRLQVQQEQLYPVRGLDYPEWDNPLSAETYGAVQLFVQRARRVQPDFMLTETVITSVLQIVRLLAGQPLAIELAAAWIDTMTPAEIATHLRSGLDLLASEARNIPARHRSMRATYRFSWERLNPQEQRVHSMLAVFRDSFTREAAVQVTGASLSLLQALINQSLLERHQAETGAIRYTLHELLRQFAEEQLRLDPALEQQVRTQHATYYLQWMGTQVMTLLGPAYQRTLRTIETEFNNVEAAWEWAVTQLNVALVTTALPIMSAYAQRRRRYHDGHDTCARVVTRLRLLPPTAAQPRLQALALAWQGAFAVELSQLQSAQRVLECSLSLLNPAEDQLICAFVYAWLGRIDHLQSDLVQANHWLESSLALYQAHHDALGTARTLSRLGDLAWLMGDYTATHHWYAESLALYRTLDDVIGRIVATSDLAVANAMVGEHASAIRLFAEADAIVQTLDDALEIAQARRHIGYAMLKVGHNADAQRQYEACLAISARYEPHRPTIDDSTMLGLARLQQGHYDQAVMIGQEAFVLANQLGYHRAAGLALMVSGLAELGRGAYGQACTRLQQCLSVYQTVNTADDQGFTLYGLSHAQRALGDRQGARQLTLNALAEAAQRRNTRAAGLALAAYIGVLLDEEEIELAIELETLVMRHPFGANSPFYRDLITRPVAHYADQLPAAVVELVRKRGQARSLLATLDEMCARH